MRGWSERLFAAFLVSLITWCVIWSALFVKDLFGSGAKVVTPAQWVSVEELRIAHHYHGINASYRDEKGWHFWREGRRCRLFTDGCLNRIKKELG